MSPATLREFVLQQLQRPRPLLLGSAGSIHCPTKVCYQSFRDSNPREHAEPLFAGNPESLIVDHIRDVLRRYAAACMTQVA
jgi:tagatose-1,6-bisphosphate aldolase non-catalytic subunit AgaZ/GatZ